MAAPVEGIDLTSEVVDTSKWPQYTGGFTDVYIGTLKSNRQRVAVKVFRVDSVNIRGSMSREDISRRTRREAKVWKTLKHKNVQPFLGYAEIGPPTSPTALITPYCESGTVNSYLCTCHASVLPKEKLSAILGITEGLSYLHGRGVVHGDIKPANVLMHTDATGAVARLCDLGRARVLGVRGYTTKLVAGSYQCMAPELLVEEDSEATELEKPSDIYALAMLYYSILEGREPFGKLMDYAVVPKVKRGDRPKFSLDYAQWESVVRMFWHLEPNQRPEIGGVLQDVQSICS